MKAKTKTSPKKNEDKRRVTPEKPDAVSIAEVMPDVIDRLSSMGKAALIRRTELEKFAARSPQTKPCPIGGLPHRLNLDESSRASYGKERFFLVYDDCQRCEAATARETIPGANRFEIPLDLINSTFDGWKPATTRDHITLNKCREFALRPVGMSIFFGPVGTGKSHLAIATMHAAKQDARTHGEKFTARFITQNGILRGLRARYDNPKIEDVVEVCKRADLLVLDELGVSSGGRDEYPALYEILSYRYSERARLGTIITTNVPPKDYVSIFEDRLADRLTAADYHPFSGPSHRGGRK